MTKKILSVFVFLVISATAFSQTDSLPKKNWIVKWNAGAAVDIATFPTLQFGIERKLNNFLSVQAEAGIQLYDFRGQPDTLHIKPQGFKMNAEVRFYPFRYFKRYKKNNIERLGFFAGIQGYYRFNKYTASTIYNPSLNTPRILDYFGVIKKVYGTNLTLGYQKQFFKKQFVFEPYMTVGYSYRDIRNNNREYYSQLGHIENNGPHDYFGNLELEESSGYNGNFSIGIRLGYQF